MKAKWKIICIIAIVLFVAVFVYSAYNIFIIEKQYYEAAAKISELKETIEIKDTDKKAGDIVLNSISMQSIAKMKEKYPDLLGWITFPDTNIDYPVMKAENNDKYLHSDVDMNWSLSGTPFVDCRNSGSFTEFSSVMYGHYMRDGSGFANIKKYRNQNYFNSHNVGYFITPDKAYVLTPVAVSNVDASDDTVYHFKNFTSEDISLFWNTIFKNLYAKGIIDASGADARYVVLSSCTYEWETARMVLVCSIKEYE